MSSMTSPNWNSKKFPHRPQLAQLSQPCPQPAQLSKIAFSSRLERAHVYCFCCFCYVCCAFVILSACYDIKRNLLCRKKWSVISCIEEKFLTHKVTLVRRKCYITRQWLAWKKKCSVAFCIKKNTFFDATDQAYFSYPTGHTAPMTSLKQLENVPSIPIGFDMWLG